MPKGKVYVNFFLKRKAVCGMFYFYRWIIDNGWMDTGQKKNQTTRFIYIFFFSQPCDIFQSFFFANKLKVLNSDRAKDLMNIKGLFG